MKIIFFFQDVVQSLIAELLNSNSWKDRVTACKVIPKLKGGANKVCFRNCDPCLAHSNACLNRPVKHGVMLLDVKYSTVLQNVA